jgi:hypothetical protein
MAIKKSELYSALWKSCDELRGGMDASQYWADTAGVGTRFTPFAAAIINFTIRRMMLFCE